MDYGCSISDSHRNIRERPAERKIQYVKIVRNRSERNGEIKIREKGRANGILRSNARKSTIEKET